MRDKLLKAATAAVDLAAKAGAKDVWASSSQNRSVDLSYRDDKLETAEEATSRSLSIKLYVDGKFSAHSTTDLREDRLSDFVAEAVAMTKALEPDEHRRITDPKLFEGRPSDDLKLVDPGVRTVENEGRIANCEKLVASARGHEKVLTVSSWTSDGTYWGAAASSNGFSGSWEGTWYWMGASVTVQDEGEKRPNGGMAAGGHHRTDVPDPADIGKQALDVTVARLGSTKGPTARTNMVVDPRVARRLVGMLLGPGTARSLQQKQSFWAELREGQAFSDKLTIVDDPVIPAGMGSRQFDDEGVAARKIPIIEKGRVRNFYVDTYYGSKLGMDVTTGSPSNRVITLGDKPLAELMAEAKEGIYVTRWLGGNSDGTTGDFSLGCHGHLIENGKIGAPVGEMNVTGNLKELFSSLVAVGNDPWPYSSMLCPTLVFEGVQFSGA